MKRSTKRNIAIYNEKMSGATLTQLSQKYNLSLPRIYQIVRDEELRDVKEQLAYVTKKIDDMEETNFNFISEWLDDVTNKVKQAGG